jgi:hypothetical protein
MTKGMRGAFAVGMAISSLGLTAAANAAVTNIYTLNQDGCSSKCSPNSQDNVSVVDDGSGTLDVTLTLFGGDSIHNNPDANHHALVFDLADAPAIIISGLPSPFTANGDQIAASYKDPSFDSFEYAILVERVDVGDQRRRRAALLICLGRAVKELGFAAAAATIAASALCQRRQFVEPFPQRDAIARSASRREMVETV